MSYKLPLFAAAAFLGGYMLISNRQLRVNEYELKVSKLPENFVGKKILLLADLHKKRYGDNFNNLVNSCIAAEPDFIFFAGDLYSRDETDMIPKLALMKRLKHIAPTYYIFGNHETTTWTMPKPIALKLTECGVSHSEKQHGADKNRRGSHQYIRHSASPKILPQRRFFTSRPAADYKGRAYKTFRRA